MVRCWSGRGAGAVAGNVVVVGNHRWRYSAEQDWCDAFRAEGWTVVEVAEREATAAQLVQAANRTDLLLWVSSSERHDRAVMERCRERTTTVAWHADLFWGLAGRHRDWKRSPMWAAEFVFTADGGNDERWASIGVEDHRWMLPGVREAWTRTPGRLRDGYRCDVAFVGNDGGSYHREWPYRGELVEALREMCARNGWSFRNPGGAQRRVERGRAMCDVYASARVTVGDSLCLDRENARYWSDRVYEACGRGGVLVMPQIEALAAEGCPVPMYGWGDWRDLQEKVGGLLEDTEAATGLRHESRAWAAGAHTYRHRVRAMLTEVGL